MAGAQKLVPKINNNDVIATFAGLRAIPDAEDFIIGSTKVRGLINAIGISSPGLTAAPAIAKHIINIVRREELVVELVEKTKYYPGRPNRIVIADATAAAVDNYIKNNPAYGNVTCRCELVTEGELIDAIAGAKDFKTTSLKGLRYRTRLGQGRCQGGFCTQRSIFILARELGIRPEQVTLKGPGSQLVFETGKGGSNIPSNSN